MGYYSNFHILCQNDREASKFDGWGNEYESLLEDLYAELEFYNEIRPKDWNDQYFDAGLAKVRSLREQIEKLKLKPINNRIIVFFFCFCPIQSRNYPAHKCQCPIVTKFRPLK